MSSQRIDGSESYFLELIRWYRQQVSGIEALFDQASGRILPNCIETAQEMLKALKNRLAEDRKVGSNSRFAFSAAARTYYSTVMEAQTRISVKVNSHPNQEWLTDLYSFMIDIDFYYPSDSEDERN